MKTSFNRTQFSFQLQKHLFKIQSSCVVTTKWCSVRFLKIVLKSLVWVSNNFFYVSSQKIECCVVVRKVGHPLCDSGGVFVHSLCDSRKVFSSLVDFKGGVLISCVIQKRCFLILYSFIICLYSDYYSDWVNLFV